MAGKKDDGDIQVVRIPFLGSPTNRATSASKDQRFVNCFFEAIKNPVAESMLVYLVKRPGLSQRIQPSSGAGVGRGIASWRGDIYTVIGNKLFKNSTDLGVTLTTTTGQCGITWTHPTAVTQYIGINDGVRLYLISTSGVVTTVTAIPTPNTTDLVYMDTYWAILKTDGTLWLCDSNDPTTWSVSDFLINQMFNGDGVGLAHQNNLMYAFNSTSAQAFWDAANSSGSPFSNAEQAVLQVGCAANNSIAGDESLMTWVGASGTGGFTVWMVEGTTGTEEIATTEIRRVLDAESTSISTARAMLIRTNGKKLYILTLSSQSRTFVYDFDLKAWCEWEGAAGGRWPIMDTCQHAGGLIAQHESNGWVYNVSPTVYQDDSVSFTVLARFSLLDFDTSSKRKFCNGYDLVGDKQTTTTNVLFQYSDDDYVTYSTAQTFDMSLTRPFISNHGNFRRRGHQLSYTGANPLRLQALEIRLRMGS